MLIHKRILIFSTAYLPLIGGAEIAVKEITDRLPDYEFTLIAAKLKKELLTEEKIGNVQVHRIGRGNNFDKFRLIWLGCKKARSIGDFDLVWSIMASFGGLAALKYKNKFPKVPLLLTLQEGDSLSRIYSRMIFCWRSFKQLFKSADRIQVISNYLGGWARKMGAKCQIDVVPNGVDIEKFRVQNSNFQADEIRKKFGIKDGDKIIVTVSRLEKKNGTMDLINSINFLPENHHLIIIGTGSLESKLEKHTARLDLAGRVHFVGNVSYDGIPPYLWTSDVFCRPSLSEGLGNAFLEAMAASLPVIATPVGGIPDFLRDKEIGLFCKVNNPKDIALKIEQVLGDESLRNYIINNAKIMVEEKYNWDDISKKINKIFIELCAY